ncbi:MAG TPA: hypothetical protein VKB59_22935 [Micromonosporaceae bacterium]|nr:hypothetical protein [Micromonosporaceae bacterium]
MQAVVRATAWTIATVAAIGLTGWLVFLFFSNPTVTVFTSPSGSSAQCHSLAAIATGHDSPDGIDAGYITNGAAATEQAIDAACDEKRIGKLTLIALIVAPTTIIDVAFVAAVRRYRMGPARQPA